MRKLKNEELDRLSVAEYKTIDKTPIVVVLDNIRSLNNIGSVFRTGDGFCIEAVYLCGITATPPNKDIHKTALGATESVNWKYFTETEDAVNELKQNGYKIISVEQAEKSTSLENFETKSTEKYALIFGHEVKGVAQKIVDMSDICLEIPQFGTKHSFNISVSAGIVLWDLFKKLKYDK
ncbi:MAG: RNA methyltransferase [Salinivirgaceae bacterium]|nr:RNA methyltransferase [Salinivirgaceae bacterium]